MAMRAPSASLARKHLTISVCSSIVRRMFPWICVGGAVSRTSILCDIRRRKLPRNTENKVLCEAWAIRLCSSRSLFRNRSNDPILARCWARHSSMASSSDARCARRGQRRQFHFHGSPDFVEFLERCRIQ